MLNRIVIYLLGAAALAALTFFVTRSFLVQPAPIKVMSTIDARLSAGAGGWNACFHNPV